MRINKIIITFIRFVVTIIIILLVIYAALNLARKGYDYGYRVFTETAIDDAPGSDRLLTYTEDMSALELGQAMEERGLIRDAWLFVLQLETSAYRKKLIPGTYTLNTSMTPKEMIVLMGTPPAEDTEATEAE